MSRSPAALDFDRVRIDPSWALRIPVSLAMRRRVLPFALLHGRVHVACLDPDDTLSLEAVARFTGLPVAPVRVSPDALARALGRVFGDGRQRSTPAPDSTGPDDASGLTDDLLRAALMRLASDLHIDPERDSVRVRLRVDGVLEDLRRLPLTQHAPLSSRIKVLAGMDIAERRAPQDGGFAHHYSVGDKVHTVDVRVASLPTRHGERLSIRLLPAPDDWLSLENLGLSPADLATFSSMLDQPHGLALLTGPTGSGKSTTLHAAMRHLLARQPLNIISVEDPIEYEIPGVAQVEVDSADKVSFSRALRSLLRHDPDVLVIGEIRDAESLDIAVKASLTGHLVLSTLHANNAIGVVTRLIDMGLPEHLIGATLRLAVAQRLVRRLCPDCRQPATLSPADAAALGQPDLAGATVHRPGACLYCAGRGYSGRTGLFECASIDAGLATLIARGIPEAELSVRFRQKGFCTLLSDGTAKTLAGLTTVRDVLDAASDL